MTREQRWVLAVTATASFVVALDTLVVSTALSTIRQHLHASLAELEWTVNAYVLTLAALMMATSALGDRFGRRKLMTAGRQRAGFRTRRVLQASEMDAFAGKTGGDGTDH